MDSLDTILFRYLDNPDPAWELSLVDVLVSKKEAEINQNQSAVRPYSTSGIWTGMETPKLEKENISTETFLEYPSISLRDFYTEHDLDLLPINLYKGLNVAGQMKAALGYLFALPDCGKVVSRLVKMIQVLRQPAPEYDVSYSHPGIPFTVFVSIGARMSDLDELRLAESILHEAMHLKLTLIEAHIPLIADNTGMHYSPWREAMRPLRGVLHAIFVFRKIRQWYEHFLDESSSFEIEDFAGWRIENIDRELSLVRNFYKEPGLSPEGAKFSQRLL